MATTDTTTDKLAEARAALARMEDALLRQWQVWATKDGNDSVRNFLTEAQALALRDKFIAQGWTVNGCRDLRGSEQVEDAAVLRTALAAHDTERAAREKAEADLSTLGNAYHGISVALTEAEAELAAHRTFALRLARIVASPDAVDLADKLTVADLGPLGDAVDGRLGHDYGDGHAAGSHARFARCGQDITRALGDACNDREAEHLEWGAVVERVRKVASTLAKLHAGVAAPMWLPSVADALGMDEPFNATSDDVLDAVRAMAGDLAALRIEHEAWGAIIDATREGREKARERVAELEAEVARLQKVERALSDELDARDDEESMREEWG